MIPFRFEAAPSARPGEREITVPAGIETKAALLTFLARAISLPDYFGHNWDALEECLQDLGWMAEEKIALVHCDLPLEESEAEARTYLQILSVAALDSKRLSVVFPKSSQSKITRLLAAR